MSEIKEEFGFSEKFPDDYRDYTNFYWTTWGNGSFSFSNDWSMVSHVTVHTDCLSVHKGDFVGVYAADEWCDGSVFLLLDTAKEVKTLPPLPEVST